MTKEVVRRGREAEQPDPGDDEEHGVNPGAGAGERENEAAVDEDPEIEDPEELFEDDAVQHEYVGVDAGDDDEKRRREHRGKEAPDAVDGIEDSSRGEESDHHQKTRRCRKRAPEEVRAGDAGGKRPEAHAPEEERAENQKKGKCTAHVLMVPGCR